MVRHTRGSDQKETQKVFIASVIRALTGAPEPTEGQIESVRRLVYLKQDTVLVAATGYGKSAVLQAVAEKEVPGSTPIFIDSDTYLKVSWLSVVSRLSSWTGRN